MYGDIATRPYQISIPQPEKKDALLPDIRSQTTRKLTKKQYEYCQTEKPINYQVFDIQKMKSIDKRATCVKSGSEIYQTLPKRVHSSYFQK